MTDFTVPLEPGTRIRNHGERYPNAFAQGTGTILERVRTYGDGTHEYRVARDSGDEVLWNYVHPVPER